MTVNLDDIRQPRDSKFLSGRPAGESARVHFKLDQLDRSTDERPNRVSIPNDLYALNLSFFLGMFGPSIRKFGKERFRSRYVFEGRPVHQKTVDEGISRALAEATIFANSKAG